MSNLCEVWLFAVDGLVDVFRDLVPFAVSVYALHIGPYGAFLL